MVYKYTNSRGIDYFLHHHTVVAEDGKETTFYFFLKETQEGSLEDLPNGYAIGEMKGTQTPVLVLEGAPEGAGSFLEVWEYPSPRQQDTL